MHGHEPTIVTKASEIVYLFMFRRQSHCGVVRTAIAHLATTMADRGTIVLTGFVIHLHQMAGAHNRSKLTIDTEILYNGRAIKIKLNFAQTTRLTCVVD